MKRWLYGLSLVLAGCATVPPMISGTGFADLTPNLAQTRDSQGQRVRWGGSVVSAVPDSRETCFEIVSRPLDSTARPEDTDRTDGRFIACAPGFYDPAVYTQGREVTVTGTLKDSVVRKIGEHDYRFPRIKADAVYLWPKRAYYEAWPGYYRNPYWFYYPYPYWYRYPYWW